jgi:hypothetical protein
VHQKQPPANTAAAVPARLWAEAGPAPGKYQAAPIASTIAATASQASLVVRNTFNIFISTRLSGPTVR